jgi:hypothetical protein
MLRLVLTVWAGVAAREEPRAVPATVVTPVAEVPAAVEVELPGEVELEGEARAKLQGAMAMVLKHSGAFGKAAGPLQGKPLARGPGIG